MQRHATVPKMITYSAAICECGKGHVHLQALHLLRAVQLQYKVIVPDAITCGAVITADSVSCERDSTRSSCHL